LQTFDAPFHFAVAHEIAQPAHDLPGPNGLLGRFVEGFPDRRQGLRIRIMLEKVAGALGLVGDGRERLVELVGKGGRERPHLADSADVGEF
jgi:hypothetical protein